MKQTPHFQLNGKPVSLDGTEPTESLLRWLKRQSLTGTKEGCADGDCGACTVAMVEVDADGIARYRAINSCLLPMGALPGREILTVEALAQGDVLHPVQQAMIDCAGSQCGYCTPGFVMSLFVGQCNGELDDATTEGNLCRCTGYGPIRKATEVLRLLPPATNVFRNAVLTPSATLRSAALADFFNPHSLDEALALKAAHPEAVWIAGATDMGVNLSHGQEVAPAFIALDRLAELQQLVIGETKVRIGAGIPLSRIEAELHGVFPALDQMLPWFAARQIRNRATFGGNLGSASPIGDLLPLLLALDADIHLRSLRGERTVTASGFFLDYRKTERADDEVIMAVTIPRRAGITQGTHKVAKRQTDDISIVAAVFALGLDASGRIDHARLAYGGVAAVPLRATKVENFLHGRALDETTVAIACTMLREAFTPLSDHRASAAYRAQLCGSLFAKFVAEQGP